MLISSESICFVFVFVLFVSAQRLHQTYRNFLGLPCYNETTFNLHSAAAPAAPAAGAQPPVAGAGHRSSNPADYMPILITGLKQIQRSIRIPTVSRDHAVRTLMRFASECLRPSGTAVADPVAQARSERMEGAVWGVAVKMMAHMEFVDAYEAAEMLETRPGPPNRVCKCADERAIQSAARTAYDRRDAWGRRRTAAELNAAEGAVWGRALRQIQEHAAREPGSVPDVVVDAEAAVARR